MQPYTLVVIDVQPAFNPAAEQVVEPVSEEMRVAIRNSSPILLVEYCGQGRTLVRDVADMYPLCWTITKRYDSGAQEIEQALNDYKLPQRIRVCGVNTSACISRTVSQLSLAQIEVVRAGCRCISTKSHMDGIIAMSALPNVKIVQRLQCA